MKQLSIKVLVFCLVIVGAAMIAISYRTSRPKPQQVTRANPPVTKPEIPPSKPLSITVQNRSTVLIDHAPMDQNLLAVSQDGVVPGEKPGLFVKPKTSTLPATHQDGTVIIGGHAYAEHTMVFNPLNDLTQEDIGHSFVILEMPNGTLRYTIEAIFLVDKIALPTQKALADNRPGRIELITCDVRNGNDTYQNRIVVACDASHVGCGSAD